ncbi:glutaredoxin domain-containing protein [Lactococcus lactis]
MVIVYYRPGCSSSRKALAWLKEHDVPYKKYRIEQLSKEKLMAILTLTDNGLTDLFKEKGNL